MSAHGWVSVDRAGRDGEVVVRLRRGALRTLGEAELAAEIRSALLAAARTYTELHRDRQHRAFGALPEEIREWGLG